MVCRDHRHDSSRAPAPRVAGAGAAAGGAR